MQIQGMKTSVHMVGARQDVVLLTVIGYIDTTTCKALARQIRDLMDQAQLQIIADLGGVGYISSAGWGVFVGEIKNIRERGGDLKIVQMTAEVIEVFEMLEFNRILNHYETIEEALNEFDVVRGLEVNKSQPPRNIPPVESVEQYRAPVIDAGRQGAEGGKSQSKSINQADLPLVEKIKLIVIANPVGGVRSIQRELRAGTYGSVRVGWWKIRKILKELNLENKDKRFRFYRSR